MNEVDRIVNIAVNWTSAVKIHTNNVFTLYDSSIDLHI